MDKVKIKEQYERDGFYIFRNVIDADLLAELNAHAEWLIQRYPDVRPEKLVNSLMLEDAFWTRLATDERLVDIAEIFLGPNLALFASQYVCKPPHDGQVVLWHQDGAYWKLAPMEALTLWVAVDPSTTENGCLRVLPGSHHLALQEFVIRADVPNMLSSSMDTAFIENSLETDKAVDLILAPGDISIHHSHLVHSSEPNTSSQRRCGVAASYMPTSTRITAENLKVRPILVRGKAVPGINEYRTCPLYEPEKSIPFKGWEEWNQTHTEALNA